MISAFLFQLYSYDPSQTYSLYTDNKSDQSLRLTWLTPRLCGAQRADAVRSRHIIFEGFRRSSPGDGF